MLVTTACTAQDAPPAVTEASAPARAVPEASDPLPAAARPDSQRTSSSAARAMPDDGGMSAIRAAVARDPQRALELIASADALRSGDAHAEERAWLAVDALVAMQQIGRARAAAEDFLRRYPASAQAERIRALTGVHPRPLGPRE